MLKIWGRMSSINVKKVVWTAQELGLDFQRTEAGGLFGIVKTPEYVRLNPNSMVPVIEDEDFTLWESNVIVRYLCAKHSAGQMYPTELRARFDAERWMDWQQTTLNPASRPGRGRPAGAGTKSAAPGRPAKACWTRPVPEFFEYPPRHENQTLQTSRC